MDSIITYEYSVHNNLLSLVVKTHFKDDEEDDFKQEYTVYNIDLNNGQLLDNNTFISSLGLTSLTVIDNIKNKMMEYYNNEVTKEYLVDCNFNCYMEDKGLNNLSLKDLALFLNANGNVIAFKFYPLSAQMYDNLLETNPFEFIIK